MMTLICLARRSASINGWTFTLSRDYSSDAQAIAMTTRRNQDRPSVADLYREIDRLRPEHDVKGISAEGLLGIVTADDRMPNMENTSVAKAGRPKITRGTWNRNQRGYLGESPLTTGCLASLHSL